MTMFCHFYFKHQEFYSLNQGRGGSEIHDLSSLQILPNRGTGTELSSNFSEMLLIGTELKELKFQQFHVQQGTEELGSLIFQRNFPDPGNPIELRRGTIGQFRF